MESKHFESLYPQDAWYEEIEKMLSYIKSGNSAQLISLPGVGRSNLMGLMAFNKPARTLHLKEAENKFHFVIANFSEMKGRTLEEIDKFLFLELINSLTERGFSKEATDIQSILDQSIKAKDELILFQGLKKAISFLALEKDLHIVFMLDRFADYVPLLSPPFFSHLRVLRDSAKYKFCVVFSLNKPLEEITEPETISDFYEFVVGNTLYLPISNQKTLEFRIRFIEESLGKKLVPKVKDEILSFTGGHGKLSRLCMEAYFSEKKIPDLKDFLLRKNRVLGVLEEIWQSLTPYEQNLIAKSKIADSPYLISVGLLKENKISIPLLFEYAKIRVNKDEHIKLLKTGEIIKGDISISDQLTALEYKLLKFLIQNEGKIVERDQIITAVWGDLGSAQGISDQAIDQLIFRLRKKVEKNVNEPSTIHTIKGRGFKLTA